jgi:ketopantoate reductase
VKAHQVVDLLPELRDLFGPQTMVVTMINGMPWWYFHKLAGPYEGRRLDSVDPGGRIAAAIEPERIIGSVVYPAAELVEPGVVRVIEGNRFTLGEPDGSRSERIDALSQALMKAGFKAPVSKDIRSEIWVKLWGNLSFNPISALTHATLEDICRFPPTRALAAAMMGEAQPWPKRWACVQDQPRAAHRRRRGGGRAQDLDAAGRGARPRAGARGAGRRGGRARPHHRVPRRPSPRCTPPPLALVAR